MAWLGQRAESMITPVAGGDWKAGFTLQNADDLEAALQAVREYLADQQPHHRFRPLHVPVEEDSRRIDLYAATEEAARETGQAVAGVLAGRGISVTLSLSRWHPLGQEWEDAGAPMPETSELLREQEYRHRVDDEKQQSLSSGRPGWEVHAQLDSRHAVAALASKLGTGHPVMRYGKTLVVGAVSEEEANNLALAITREFPAKTAIYDVRGLTVRPPMPGGPLGAGAPPASM